MSETLVYPAGTAILFTEGEYSDFHHIDAVVTLVNCDLKKLEAEYRSGFPEDKDELDWDGPNPQGFVSWLVGRGYVFPAAVNEVHIGGYGRLEIET